MENFTNSNTSTDFNRDDTGFIVFQTILFVMVETVGNISLVCIIMHEKYGMDPQKRTMSNQLLSSICHFAILFNICVDPVWYTYRVYQFDNLGLKVWMLYGSTALALYTVFALAEIVAIKIIFIFFFSRAIVIIEDFGSLFLTLFNSMAVSLIIGSRLLLGEYNSNPFVTETAQPFQDELHKNANFYSTWMPGLVSLMVIAVGLPVIHIKKQRARKPPMPLTDMELMPATRHKSRYKRNEELDEKFEEVTDQFNEPEHTLAEVLQNPFHADEKLETNVSPPNTFQVTVEHHLDAEIPTKSRVIQVKPYQAKQEKSQSDLSSDSEVVEVDLERPRFATYFKHQEKLDFDAIEFLESDEVILAPANSVEVVENDEVILAPHNSEEHSDEEPANSQNQGKQRNTETDDTFQSLSSDPEVLDVVEYDSTSSRISSLCYIKPRYSTHFKHQANVDFDAIEVLESDEVILAPDNSIEVVDCDEVILAPHNSEEDHDEEAIGEPESSKSSSNSIQVNKKLHHVHEEVPTASIKLIKMKQHQAEKRKRSDPEDTDFINVDESDAVVINLAQQSVSYQVQNNSKKDQVIVSDEESDDIQACPPPTIFRFNTNRLNENILGYVGIAIFFCNIIVAIMPTLFFVHLGMGMQDFLSMYLYTFYSLNATLLPLSYFVKRPRKFFDVLEMFGIYCNNY